jgi:hypothetical protein
MTSRDGSGERWLDREAGPVVRPYAVTMGRTLPGGGVTFGLIDVVTSTGDRVSGHLRLGPEHRAILDACRRPVPVVDLTSQTDLPVGVVRVLLGDLINEGMVRVVSEQQKSVPDQRLLRMVLDGLESLLRQ